MSSSTARVAATKPHGSESRPPSGFDPIGIAVDSANRVYIADTDNDRVEVFSTT